MSSPVKEFQNLTGSTEDVAKEFLEKNKNDLQVFFTNWDGGRRIFWSEPKLQTSSKNQASTEKSNYICWRWAIVALFNKWIGVIGTTGWWSKRLGATDPKERTRVQNTNQEGLQLASLARGSQSQYLCLQEKEIV